MRVAAAPCNVISWQRPSVVYHFAEGCETDVADELCAMGATVSGPLSNPPLCSDYTSQPGFDHHLHFILIPEQYSVTFGDT